MIWCAFMGLMANVLNWIDAEYVSGKEAHPGWRFC